MDKSGRNKLNYPVKIKLIALQIFNFLIRSRDDSQKANNVYIHSVVLVGMRQARAVVQSMGDAWEPQQQTAVMWAFLQNKLI